MTKKQKNKLIAIIGASLLGAALIAAIVVLLVKNVGTTTLKIESKKAIPGDVITLPIVIDKNHGLYFGQIIVTYDSEALDLISCKNGEVFDSCFFESEDVKDTIVIITQQNGLENTKVDGVVATLEFKVKESADKGEYDICLYQSENVDEGTCFVRVQDADDDKFTVPKCQNGKIVVN